MVRAPIEPDFVFDNITEPMDQQIVDSIGSIRFALLHRDFLSTNPAAERYQDVLVVALQLLAFIGAHDEEAMTIASEFADQLQGEDTEIEEIISGITVHIEPGEPLDDVTDSSIISFDGEPIITVYNNRTVPVDVDADWERLLEYAELAFQN